MCAIVAPMRAAKATPQLRRTAMHRTPLHVSPPLHLIGPSLPAPPRVRAFIFLALASACATPPESNAPPSQPATPAPVATRTANNDARGAGMQPDYNGEAEALRQQITPRLPEPLPGDRRAACAAMLDAVVAFYSDIEPDPAARAQLLADLQTTRAADLGHCEQTTSVRAATCVQLRLADRDAEFPWLLDQCTRAFPEAPVSKDMSRPFGVVN